MIKFHTVLKIQIKSMEQYMKGTNKYKGDVLTIPNVLSVFRFSLIPLFMWLYLDRKEYTATAIILVLSGLTDVADGFIARKFNMVSDLGKAIDPIADKMTQAAMLFCLISTFPHMVFPLVLMFIKEIATGISKVAAIRKTGEVTGARWHGKVNTILLYMMLFTHVVWHSIPPTVSDCFIGLCTGSMILSFILYLISNIRSILKTRKEHMSK